MKIETESADEFSTQNPASKKLVKFWEETYSIFAESLVKEIKKVIDEGTRQKETSKKPKSHL